MEVVEHASKAPMRRPQLLFSGRHGESLVKWRSRCWLPSQCVG